MGESDSIESISLENRIFELVELIDDLQLRSFLREIGRINPETWERCAARFGVSGFRAQIDKSDFVLEYTLFPVKRKGVYLDVELRRGFNNQSGWSIRRTFRNSATARAYQDLARKITKYEDGKFANRK